MDLKNYSLSDNKKKHNEVIKVIAIICMLIDHIGLIFFPSIETLRIIGRLAFPIFAYQIAQGYTYTSNVNKYMFRLWIFAIISQIPYSLVLDTFRFNVIFTLAISLFFMDRFAKKEYSWLFTLLVIPIFVDLEYGLYGIALPIAFYLTKDKKLSALVISSILIVAYTFWTEFWIMFYTLIGVLIVLYLPKEKLFNIKLNKYFFYWFYPGHLLILFIIKMVLISILI